MTPPQRRVQIATMSALHRQFVHVHGTGVLPRDDLTTPNDRPWGRRLGRSRTDGSPRCARPTLTSRWRSSGRQDGATRST